MSESPTKHTAQSRPPGSTAAASAPGTDPSTARSTGAAQATAKEAQDKASEVVRSVENQAAAASEQIKRQASQAVRTASEKTYQAAERAKQSGRQYADEKKQVLAQEIDVFSGAIRKASTKLHDEQHDSIASYLDAAVEQLDDVREALQQQSVGELLEGAGRLARRRPELVYSGMFLAGLAAVRFLKASKRQPAGDKDRNSEQSFEHSIAVTSPPTAGATRPISAYPQPRAASSIHRTAGFPNTAADSPSQPTSPGELR